MKTIGLLGGMSWESTIPYYRIINETVNRSLGGLHSARIVLYSVEFHEIERLQHTDEWEKAGEILGAAGEHLKDAGADFLILCTNTMHRVASQVETRAGVPILHIADATAAEIRNAGVTTVGLVGTRFTMEQDFYLGRLVEKHGLDVLVPEESDREIVHGVIFDELCLGKVLDASREAYRRIVRRLAEAGAEGIILGCTEIPMLLAPDDSPVPLFDTTAIHARAAAVRALEE
jgi:aspartate racemase